MLQHATDNSLILDGKTTGLKAAQRREGTVVYTPESRLSGQAYREHAMPHTRYSLSHDSPIDPRTGLPTGAAGRAQFEADLRDLLARLQA